MTAAGPARVPATVTGRRSSPRRAVRGHRAEPPAGVAENMEEHR
ncbi:hypothetical protein ACFQX6_07550 [Streptosporangium lutulentum]